MGPAQGCASQLVVIPGDTSVVFIGCILGPFTSVAIIMSDRKLLAELETERHGAGSSEAGK